MVCSILVVRRCWEEYYEGDMVLLHAATEVMVEDGGDVEHDIGSGRS